MKGIKIDKTVVQAVIKAHEKGIARRAIADQFDISLRSVGRIIKAHAKDSGPEERKVSNPTMDRMERIAALEKRILALEKQILESSPGAKT